MPLSEMRFREIIRQELKAIMPVRVPQLLTPKEAAKILKVAEGTLSQWRTEGIGPKYFKAGGIKYELKDIVRYLQSVAVKGAVEYDPDEDA